MSGTHSSQGELTRRGFLKASAAVGALGLAGAAGMTAADEWLAPATAHAEPEERVAYTYHQSHCRGNCMLKCTVRDGRLCLIEPNEAVDEGFRTVCVKGLSEIQHVYSADRIQTPLKRVGERGSNEFVPITWDEAMEIFADNVKACWDKYGKESVYLGVASEAETYKEIKNVLGMVSEVQHGLDIGHANGFAPMFGPKGNAYSGVNDIRDWRNTKTFLATSLNFLESSLVLSRHFFEAKESGMHTVAVDPHFSTMAAKCDEWVPIDPGTDSALYLGMTSCVLDEGWYDEDFVAAHTSFPFLVDVESGMLLRGDGEKNGSFVVWDALSNAAVGCDEVGVLPDLEGEHIVDGRTCATVFSLLKKRQASFDAEWAAGITGIPAESIRAIAKRYATEGPAFIALGFGGCDKYANADVAGHAAGILAALTGNVGRSGTGLGYPGTGAFSAAPLGSWPLPADMKAIPLKIPTFELPYADNDIKCFIGIGDQLQQHFADLDRAAEWLKTLDFIVYADIYHITCAKYADLVLPISSRFECEEEIGGIRSAKNHLALRERVIDPLFESKSDYALEYELAKALGLEEALPSSIEERVAYQLENAKSPRIAGMTIESLRENQGVLPYKDIDSVYAPLSTLEFATESGRLEAYYENLRDFGQALPEYEPPIDSAPDSSLRREFPLQLSQVRTRFHIHDQFCDATWIRQLFDTVLEMNPVDLRERGLVDGDEVEVFNDRGSFGCPVRANESVRPGSIRLFEGEWTKFMTFGNFQNVTNPSVTDRGRVLPNGPVIPFNDTLVEVKKA